MAGFRMVQEARLVENGAGLRRVAAARLCEISDLQNRDQKSEGFVLRGQQREELRYRRSLEKIVEWIKYRSPSAAWPERWEMENFHPRLFSSETILRTQCTCTNRSS